MSETVSPVYKPLSMGELRRSYEPTTWTIDGLLPQGGIGLIVGEPGIGKTWLVLAAALAVATRSDWLGHFECLQGKVLLVLEEDDKGSVIERWDLLGEGLGLSQEEADQLPVGFLIQEGVSLTDQRSRNEVANLIQSFKPRMVILDSLRRVNSADENDSSQMARLFRTLHLLTQKTDPPCSILLTHHMRKRTESDFGSLDRIRGSSDIAASVDSVLQVFGGLERRLHVKQSKSKRGPTIESFDVVQVLEDDAIRLEHASHKTQKEKQAGDFDRCKEWILSELSTGPINKSGLRSKGKGPRGFGRSNIEAAIDELVGGGMVEIKQEGRSHILHLRVAAGPESEEGT